MAQRIGIGYASGGGGGHAQIIIRHNSPIAVDWAPLGRIMTITHVGKTLSSETLESVRKELDKWEKKPSVKGVAFKINTFGMNINEFPSCANNQKDASSMAGKWHGFIKDIMRFSKPTIALIDGYAVGGGYEWSLACDYIAARTDSKIGLPEIKLGLLPGGGGTQTLTRRVGISRALWMILEGQLIAPSKPWVDKVVESTDALLDDLSTGKLVVSKRKHDAYIPMLYEMYWGWVTSYIARMRWKGPVPASFPLARDAVMKGSMVYLNEQGLGYERNAFTDAFRTHDAREGIAAFLEKRTPCFQGM